MAVMGLVALPAFATSITITPDDLVVDPALGDFGWDYDEAAPLGSADGGYAPGFGDSAWYSDVDGTDAGRTYTALRIYVPGLFGHEVTVADLADISYYTNWVGGDIDWRVNIYTLQEVSTDPGWYDYRISLNSPSSGEGDGDWDYWSAADNLGVYSVRTGGATETYSWTWDSVGEGALGDEQVMFIDIIAGANSPRYESYSYLDGVTIALVPHSPAEFVEINLEAPPVPEPASMAVLGLGLLGLAGRRYLKRRKTG